MPEGLEIEREQNINGSMPSYAEQVLISTGRSDWKSRIEDDDDGGGGGGPDAAVVKQLKAFFTRGGKYMDPYHNVMLTASSFPHTECSDQHTVHAPPSNGTVPTSKPSASIAESTASAFILPSFHYVPSIPTDEAGVEAFIKAYLLPSQLHQSHDTLSREQKNILLRQPELQAQFAGARPVNEVLVLICGHGNRDERCGILGPLLEAEFEDKLRRQNISIVSDALAIGPDRATSSLSARIGLISHIGGHKWAGNVIVYVPPGWHNHPLAGKGIWYGRVEPQHVEGIVGKTILDGKVIKELFRGGIDGCGGKREIIRL
ncbi:Altered inheritance of mitochondria protein 32 [Teratosphaeria destructans]|uniref:Altered inheritance of mitochondria protein 32 n=1 Tax=Teratosphaeria destructans TaxID=418781 RepID=A0A9W7SVG4_9PEZI|nr:Altered inheritance of mitochondria protein 32 [Teratosphaeria destructans]